MTTPAMPFPAVAIVAVLVLGMVQRQVIAEKRGDAGSRVPAILACCIAGLCVALWIWN